MIFPFKDQTAANVPINVDSFRIRLESILSRVPLLKISAEADRYRLAEIPPTPRQIFEETGATYLLEGNVENHGDSVQLTVQLTDSKAGFRIWSEQFSTQIEPDQTVLLSFTKLPTQNVYPSRSRVLIMLFQPSG